MPNELENTLYRLLSFEGVLGERSVIAICFGGLGFLCIHWRAGA